MRIDFLWKHWKKWFEFFQCHFERMNLKITYFSNMAHCPFVCYWCYWRHRLFSYKNDRWWFALNCYSPTTTITMNTTGERVRKIEWLTWFGEFPLSFFFLHTQLMSRQTKLLSYLKRVKYNVIYKYYIMN